MLLLTVELERSDHDSWPLISLSSRQVEQQENFIRLPYRSCLNAVLLERRVEQNLLQSSMGSCCYSFILKFPDVKWKGVGNCPLLEGYGY